MFYHKFQLPHNPSLPRRACWANLQRIPSRAKISSAIQLRARPSPLSSACAEVVPRFNRLGVLSNEGLHAERV
jgi:hypothetical protein